MTQAQSKQSGKTTTPLKISGEKKSVPASSSSGGWQAEMAQAVRSVEELAKILGIEPIPHSWDVTGRAGLRQKEAPANGQEFPLLVPRPFVAKMKTGDPHDPLLLQILPDAAELLDGRGGTRSSGGFVSQTDPLQEADASRQKHDDIIQKYFGRSLWLLSSSCPVHCRYCFRRHQPVGPRGDRNWRERVRRFVVWAKGQPELAEVIWSGGDPLLYPDGHLEYAAAALESVEHLRILRIHSRMPVVLPQRIDQRFLDWVSASRLNVVMVLHLNHCNEICGDLANACAELAAVGVKMYGQSVLLKGINDQPRQLASLFTRQWKIGIQPYYLHLLDPVAGAGHFDIPQWRAQQIYGELAAQLPGYMLPRLVRETVGRPAKTQILPSF